MRQVQVEATSSIYSLQINVGMQNSNQLLIRSLAARGLLSLYSLFGESIITKHAKNYSTVPLKLHASVISLV